MHVLGHSSDHASIAMPILLRQVLNALLLLFTPIKRATRSDTRIAFQFCNSISSVRLSFARFAMNNFQLLEVLFPFVYGRP